jgi:glyoxylase I family protein
MTSVTAEGIAMQTTGLHHIALRSADLARAKVFYIERLGFPLLLEAPNLIIFAAGASAIAIDGPVDATPTDDHFNPFRVGLDHMALGCTDPRELRRVAAALTSAGIQNTGVKTDPTLNKEYVAFKDPDGISWEFYMV